MDAEELVKDRKLYISSELSPLLNKLTEKLNRKRDYDEEHGSKSCNLTIDLSESEVTTITSALQEQMHRMKQEAEQMKHDFNYGFKDELFKVISDLGTAIVGLAEAFKCENPNTCSSFGEACGTVIGLALDLYSKHDNSADILQAADALKMYVQLNKEMQRAKYMIQ
ncbi:MAG: hypothetical protein HDT43_00845 [Ruminococcaceae bacterium]|nr:hypothetical protein [Oscillospiraceae bacterium]